MSAFPATWALAKADVLERTRSYGFLVFTGLMLWLGYGTYAGHVHVTMGPLTGHWNSAWAGGAMALITNTFLTLVGFWFVRRAFDVSIPDGDTAGVILIGVAILVLFAASMGLGLLTKWLALFDAPV